MRFLLALDNFSRGTGGAPASAREIARALLAAGHSVFALERGDREGAEDLDGVAVARANVGGRLLPRDRDVVTLVLNPRWERRVSESIRELHPDLVITQGMFAPGTIQAAAAAGVPSAYFFRGYAPLCPEQYVGIDPMTCRRPDCTRCLNWAARLKWPLVKSVLRLYDRTIPRADLLVANSRYIAGLLERFWGVRAEVVLPTLNLPAAERPENDPGGFLLFVKPQAAKGLDLMLELAAACPERSFAVAGEIRGAAERRLRTLLNVELLGWRTDMPAVYRRARLLLLPSLLPEPFGRVAAEAAAVGCPTVAFDVGGIAEAAGPGAVMLPPGAAAAEWARALASADDQARYEAMRKAALEHARALTAQAGSSRLVTILERAAAKGPGPAPTVSPSSGRRLRVAHIIGALPLGGAELSVFHLVSRLDRERFDVRVICTREEGELAAKYRAAGVPVDLVRLPTRYGPRGLLRLARVLRDWRTDIVHTHMRRANTSGRLAAWLAGVPVIIAHERNLPHDKNRRHFLIDRLLATISSKVIAVSPQVAEAEAAAGGTPADKLLALPNALDTNVFRPGDRSAARRRLNLSENDFVVGFAGRLHPNKKLDVLLVAAAVAIQDVPDLRILLAGEGPLRADLEAQANRLGISERVTFLGPRTDMPEIYPAMDVLGLLSAVEGCSRTLLESLACGIPAVATPVGYASEMLGAEEAGLLVPLDNAGAAAAAFVRLAREPESRKSMSAAALERASAHGICDYVRNMERLYLELWGEEIRDAR